MFTRLSSICRSPITTGKNSTMIRERLTKVRAELWEIASDLDALADPKPVPGDDVALVARSLRTLCYILVRVIDSAP